VFTAAPMSLAMWSGMVRRIPAGAGLSGRMGGQGRRTGADRARRKPAPAEPLVPAMRRHIGVPNLPSEAASWYVVTDPSN
jgi:hypothetical protein